MTALIIDLSGDMFDIINELVRQQAACLRTHDTNCQAAKILYQQDAQSNRYRPEFTDRQGSML